MFSPPGITGGTTGLKWYFRIGVFLSLSYVLIYGIWASNNLAVNLDNQNDDRYITLEFWRLAKVGVDIITPFFTMIYLYSNTSTWLRRIHCLITVLVIGLESVCIGWFIVDIVDCSNVAHCDGDGAGPLGYDVAFWVVVTSVAARLFINLIFLLINYLVNRIVQVRNINDFYSNPNRPGTYADYDVYGGASAYPVNFVSSNIDERGTLPKYRGKKDNP